MDETIELSTLGAPIKTAYEGQPDTNAFTDAEKEKLEGIHDLATRNAADSYLLNRFNHTGVQLSNTISDLPGLLDAKVDKFPGKGLSEEDFTTDYKEALDKIISRGGFTLDREGPWDASNNTPEIANGVGIDGQFYVVSVTGTQNLGNGDRVYREGDWVIYCEGVWHRLTGSDPEQLSGAFAPKGNISPPIPALHAALSAPIDVEPMTTTNLTGWAADYDQFGMLGEDGEGFTVPAWASHARVTASVFSMHLTPEERLNVCIGMDGLPLVCGHSPGADQTLFPTVGLKTGIIPVAEGTRFTVTAWHNGDAVKKVVSGASTFISIELFEAI